MNPTCSCGCCEGIANAVPENTTNRPGLPALAYRVGTHATFLESMIARLSSHDYPALAALTTRDPADPSIALLDSWATVADVLTFYQERIANEGYLRTATERRSVLELARLIGYTLRPGVAASVYLAYTLDEDRSKNPPLPTQTLIPAGSRSQSVPGPGQLPQSFETSLDLDARSAWNTLRPRLTQPQLFSQKDQLSTNIGTRDAVYFAGMSTNLKPGDLVLFVLGPTADPKLPHQALRLVQSVEAQTAQKRTEVVLQIPRHTIPGDIEISVMYNLLATVASLFAADATAVFGGNSLALQAAALLSNPAPAATPGLIQILEAAIAANQTAESVYIELQKVLTQLTALQQLAAKRKFTRLQPWFDFMISLLSDYGSGLLALTKAGVQLGDPGKGEADREPLSNLARLIPSLSRAPSLQPASSLLLSRNVKQAFSIQSDIAPRLIGTLSPAAAPFLYRAWSGLAGATETTEVAAVRLKTGLFPGTYPGLPTSSNVEDGKGGKITTYDSPPKIDPDWSDLFMLINRTHNPPATIPLDAVYDKVQTGSWVVIDRPDYTFADTPNGTVIVKNSPVTRKLTYHKVTGVATAGMTTSDGGFSAKVTRLTLDPPWLNELTPTQLGVVSTLAGFLPSVVVYAQSERLALAEEPIDFDLAGDTIELDGVYDGLESGRWIIVSGERTDIPNVTGVSASEVVMVLGVAQATAPVNKLTRPGAIHTILTLANKLSYTYDINTVTIYGNVVKATHGETRQEILGSGDGSQALQQFALKQKPLTFIPASNPSGTDSTLKVYVNNVEWHETDTLAGLSGKDRKFVTRTADDDTTSVTFGNGRQGARLPTGSGNVAAIYRNGIGQPGNVVAGQISLLQTRPLNVKGVINPVRASGGADRDTRDQARRNAPLAVMALDRLVSVQDYADFARTFAGIGQASAARLSDGRRDLVHVTVAGAADIPIDYTSDLYANLVQALQVNGDPYLPLQVAIRRLCVLVISANIKILPDYLWEPVVAEIRAALLNAFSFENRRLGQPVYQSEVISVMQAVAGVAYVDLEILDSVAEGVTAGQLSNLATSLKLNEFIDAELARPNPTPVNFPDDAILPAELIYLTPAIPDTLILNEVKS